MSTAAHPQRRQSDDRVPGRRPPASFGRGMTEDTGPDEEFLRVLGGKPYTVVMPVHLVPSEAHLHALYDTIKATVSQAIRDAYAETMGVDLDDAGDTPDGDGGDQAAEPAHPEAPSS